MGWELIKRTKKAALWRGRQKGDRVYVVGIGTGKKQPPEESSYRRINNELVIRDSFWTYREGDDSGSALKSAEILYDKHA